MKWSVLMLVACAAPKHAAAVDDEADRGRVEGVVTVRATGQPLASAEIYFGGDSRAPYFTDPSGHYSISLPAGTTSATIVDATFETWMTSDPMKVVADKATRYDIAFAPASCTVGDRRGETDDSDVVATLALADLPRAHKPRLLVDDRHAPHVHMLSVVGFEITTRDELDFEANRRHQTVPFMAVDVALEGRCATVSIGSFVAHPTNDTRWFGEIVRRWLYIKDTAGWRRAGSLEGAVIN